jgi:hypothetical protein
LLGLATWNDEGRDIDIAVEDYPHRLARYR